MGKKKRPAPATGSPNYDKAVDRVFRRLGLSDGRTYLGWWTAAAQKVGEAAVDEFDALFDSRVSTPHGTTAVSEWCALDFDRARHLFSGWSSAAFLTQARGSQPSWARECPARPTPWWSRLARVWGPSPQSWVLPCAFRF